MDTDCTIPRASYHLSIYLINEHREILVSDASVVMHPTYEVLYGERISYVIADPRELQWVDGTAYAPEVN